MTAYRLSLLSSIVLLCLFTRLDAQEVPERIADSITYEGKQLYRSERASWLGTDIFLDKFPSKKDRIGGYLSYSTSATETRCIFFTKGDEPTVMATIYFDTTYAPRNTHVDDAERPLSNEEMELFAMRKKARKLMEEDKYFKTYNKTNLNLIPAKVFGKPKVYVLTGPQEDGIILFGNDYLITFNEDGSIRDRTMLHRNLIEMPIQKGIMGDTSIASGYHTHMSPTSAFMTATDVCTLMLYARFTNMKSYIVMSKDYYSQWNCHDNSLFIMTTKAMKRIDKDLRKRRRER